MTDLTFKDFHEANLARQRFWMPPDAPQWSLSDWGVALAGEVGEACNIIKKLRRSAGGFTGNKEADDLLRVMLQDEIGDVGVYLDLLAGEAGIDLEAAIRRVFNRKSDAIGCPIYVP